MKHFPNFGKLWTTQFFTQLIKGDMDGPTDSDLVFEAVSLLSQFLHFTHGDVCQAPSPVETERDGRKYDNPERRQKKSRANNRA